MNNNTHMTPITAIREGTVFTRGTAAVVITTFLALVLSPAAAAAKDVIQDPSKLMGKPAPVQERDTLNDSLKQVKLTLADLDKTLSAKTPDLTALVARQSQLKSLRSALIEADKEVMSGFDRDLSHIEKHKLPDIIKQRHAAAVTEYQQKHKQMLGHLDGLAATKDATALKNKVKEARDWIGKQQLEMTPAPFDPNKLGFQVETKKARAPKLNAKELKQLFPANTPLKTSSSSVIPAPDTSTRGQAATGIQFLPLPLGEAARSAGEGAFTESTEPTLVASAGSMSGLLAASAITPPGPEYLLPTTDIQITPEIQALAAQLHNNPVEIYNWVRNNVEWIPTYGSVQGSAMTLDKKAGNAFDTASLLMALLRASNIPARYVYGTIQVPIDKAMNWAGGFTDADATQTFLATGGVPNTALTSGGVTKFIQMEHVWVEAFVDFYPSRGSKNVAPDSWAPMDGSYKQYTYADGLDLQRGVPMDAEDILAQANPNVGLASLPGVKKIQQVAAPVLAASLPYRLVAMGNRYSALPKSLQHRFQYRLYANAYERSLENPLWTYEEVTPQLAGKEMAIVFVAASDADRQTIESYLPGPHADGTPVRPDELPSSFPAYSIRVTATLKVGGIVVASGGTFPLGTSLLGEGGFTTQGLGDVDLTVDMLIAGQASGLGLSLQGISQSQVDKVMARLRETRARLEARSDDISGQALTDDLLIAAVWTYFGTVESYGRIRQKVAEIAEVPGLSYGLFHAQVTPEYRYGVVHRARYNGVLMDIGHQRRVAVRKDNSLGDWIAYNRTRGQHSSGEEHAISERFLTDQTHPGQGISAVKAISVAAESGQRIFTITSENQGDLANVQQSAPVMDNIRSAIAAGKEVTIHERPISYSGFVGAGYYVIDPETGSGSYLIEGGGRGAVLFMVGTAMGGSAVLSCDGSQGQSSRCKPLREAYVGTNADPEKTHYYDHYTTICQLITSNCTFANIWPILLQFKAPGDPDGFIGAAPVTRVTAGGISVGHVFHMIDEETYTVVNLTLPDHLFYPGVVIRTLISEGGYLKLVSVGTGTGGLRLFNEVIGPVVWENFNEGIVNTYNSTYGGN